MLNHSVATNPDTPHDDETPATAAKMWARLGTAPEAANLPAPNTISVGTSHAVVYLHGLRGHDHTDLHTWAAWLRAGALTTDVYESSEAGHLQRATSAEATWRGWRVEVVLVEVVPAEQVAVAFGQTGGAR